MASNYIPNTGGFQNVPGDAGSSTTIQFRGGTDSGLPTEFSNLELTCRTYQLSDSSFSVSHALQANPGLVYSIPAQWLNTYRYTADVTAGNQVEIQLNSAPAGFFQNYSYPRNLILANTNPSRNDPMHDDERQTNLPNQSRDRHVIRLPQVHHRRMQYFPSCSLPVPPSV